MYLNGGDGGGGGGGGGTTELSIMLGNISGKHGNSCSLHLTVTFF